MNDYDLALDLDVNDPDNILYAPETTEILEMFLKRGPLQGDNGLFQQTLEPLEDYVNSNQMQHMLDVLEDTMERVRIYYKYGYRFNQSDLLRMLDFIHNINHNKYRSNIVEVVETYIDMIIDETPELLLTIDDKHYNIIPDHIFENAVPKLSTIPSKLYMKYGHNIKMPVNRLSPKYSRVYKYDTVVKF